MTLLDASVFPPGAEREPFWGHCEKKELCFQRCTACTRWRNPPLPICPRCQSRETEWRLAPDRGEIFTFTIVHYAAHPAFEAVLPYNVVLVRYPELDDLRFISNVIDTNDLRIGQIVQLVWVRATSGRWIPRFSTELEESPLGKL